VYPDSHMSRVFQWSWLLVGLFVIAIASTAHTQARPSKKRPLQYFFVLLKRPTSSPSMSKEASEKLQEEHMANIRKLANEHKLVMAGPFTDDTVLRGIFVLRVKSIAEAQELANGDPAVKAGRLSAEIYGPWFIDSNAIHQPSAAQQGMQQYALILLKRGEKWDPGAPGFADLVNQYPVALKRMTSQGKVAIAGPFPFAVPGELRGVAIFRVPADQATKLMQDDAAVKAKVLKLETHPWITATGVLPPGLPTN
jgi:uncharacterized protein YciI